MTSGLISSRESNFSVLCKHCLSINTRKYGLAGNLQHYFCNNCGHKFTSDDRLYRMKTPFIQVAFALEEYYKGFSINEIRHHLSKCFKSIPSSKTVYGWILKYTEEAINQFKDHRPIVGNSWVVSVNVLTFKGKNYYCIDVVDLETCYLLFSELLTCFEGKYIKLLIKLIIRKVGKIPKEVLLDGSLYLNDIESKLYSYRKYIKVKTFIKSDNLCYIEKWNSKLNIRINILKKCKSIDSIKKFLDGFQVYYNYLGSFEHCDDRMLGETAKINYSTKTWVDIAKIAHKKMVGIIDNP